MTILQDIGKSALAELLGQLNELGISKESLQEVTLEVEALLFILADPHATKEARHAATRSLRGIPLRIRQLAVVAEAKLVDRAVVIGERFLQFLWALIGFMPPK